MKKILFFFLFFLLLLTGSCSDHRAQMVWLAEMNSLMEKNPQAAYDSLCNHRQVMSQSGEKVEMRYRMLEAKALNKLFKPMPSDSLFQEVVDYYDSKGTPNEKMEAHYLLGCIYRDMKEAPKAMQCYQDAVESVDTLSKDCDFNSLYRIYGQMADVFVKQNLFQEAQIALQKYITYALKAKDTLNYIIGSERFIPIYSAMGDTAKAIAQTKLCARLYEKYHYHQKAIAVCVTLIEFYLDRHQYQEAHHLMQKFESQSGLFDKHGNIATPREYYYYYKAKYFLGTQQLDSAEFYFRKLGRFGYSYETTRGLLDIYRIRLNSDSIKKYSLLCEKEMDKILDGTQTKAVVLANSLYNYTRLQKKIEEEKQQKLRDKYVALIAGFIILLFVIYFVRRYRNMQKKMSAELKEVNRNYVLTFQNMEKARQELSILQENIDLSVKRKQEEIMSLQVALQEYKEKCDQFNKVGNKNALMASDIFLKFKEMARHHNRHSPSPKDWNALSAEFQHYLPVLYEQIIRSRLSTQEFQVCVLTYLNIDNTDISFLVKTTSKTISNARKKANRKLFGDDSASTLDENLLKF